MYVFALYLLAHQFDGNSNRRDKILYASQTNVNNKSSSCETIDTKTEHYQKSLVLISTGYFAADQRDARTICTVSADRSEYGKQQALLDELLRLFRVAFLSLNDSMC